VVHITQKLTVYLASGLYYLSELVEERTVLSKKILTYLIYFVIGLQLCLWLFDGFPWMWILLSIASHVLYLQNLRRFPIVKLSDPIFLISCGEYPSPVSIATSIITVPPEETQEDSILSLKSQS